MAFRRSSYVLTPPTWIVFALSAVLAIVALLVRYAGIKVPYVSAARVFDILAIAWLLLAAGVIFRRL
jgi:hypothetical protein